MVKGFEKGREREGSWKNNHTEVVQKRNDLGKRERGGKKKAAKIKSKKVNDKEGGWKGGRRKGTEKT